ncbi:hypothetical protein pb186bvf_015951 [Paramecium bursaria]
MKAQILGRIIRYGLYLKKGLPIPDIDGEDLKVLNFDFQHNAQEYLKNLGGQDYSSDQIKLLEEYKLNDEDLEQLLLDLSNIRFDGELILDNQNITDITLIRISQLITKIPLKVLSLRNTKITQTGGFKFGAVLSQSKLQKIYFTNTDLGLSTNLIMENLQNVKDIDFGIIGNQQLRYFTTVQHNLEHVGFQEKKSDPWDQGTKDALVSSISKSLLSATILINDFRHKKFIGLIELKCKDNRQEYVRRMCNQFKARDLDPDHPDYYYSDDFHTNAYKFSVKQYLSNVFESLLDESLFYLEKERQNVLRDEEIYQVTHELLPKEIMEDICTADGSIIVLAKYLLGKIKK